ncbi:MAG: hypothetical protein HN879_10040 [Flavobacteriaceae bacterium]|nr:hypothetical protein [Flavobacteriaceae bacterium]
MHTSILIFRNFRYLKITVAILAVSILAYAIHDPLGKPNGGTWLGYTLGGLAAFLILWLAWFSVRKRQYGVGKLLLEDWASGHVYLGLSLLVIATLHSGFQFGINIHTLAYGLMVLVIGSGAFGLYAYMRYPRLRSVNRGEGALGDVWALVAGMSRDCYEIARDLPDEVYALVETADKQTRIGGGVWRQLSGTDPNCASTNALNQVRDLAEHYSGRDADAARRLVRVLARKVELLTRIRKDIQYKALLDIWLYFHIPLTVALLGALAIHIVSVFLYW